MGNPTQREDEGSFRPPAPKMIMTLGKPEDFEVGEITIEEIKEVIRKHEKKESART